MHEKEEKKSWLDISYIHYNVLYKTIKCKKKKEQALIICFYFNNACSYNI